MTPTGTLGDNRVLASTLLSPNVPVGVIQSVDEQAVPAPTAVVQLIAAPEAIDWVQVQTR